MAHTRLASPGPDAEAHIRLRRCPADTVLDRSQPTPAETSRSPRRPPRRPGAAGALPPAARRSSRRPTSACGRAAIGAAHGLLPRRPGGDDPGPSLPHHPAARAAGLPALGHPHAALRAAPDARALFRRPAVRALASSARARRRTNGSGPAGRRRCRPGIRSSTGSTAWWTTPARSGRTRSGSSSRTSPVSAGCTWCRRSRKWWTRSSCRCSCATTPASGSPV